MNAATFVKKLDGFRGDARLYKLDPPLKYDHSYDGDDPQTTQHVVVSGISNEFGTETYIFPCDKDGEVTNWGELDGSFKGSINHGRALNNAGYTLKKGKRGNAKANS